MCHPQGIPMQLTFFIEMKRTITVCQNIQRNQMPYKAPTWNGHCQGMFGGYVLTHCAEGAEFGWEELLNGSSLLGCGHKLGLLLEAGAVHSGDHLNSHSGTIEALTGFAAPFEICMLGSLPNIRL